MVFSVAREFPFELRQGVFEPRTPPGSALSPVYDGADRATIPRSEEGAQRGQGAYSGEIGRRFDAVISRNEAIPTGGD